MKLVKFKVDYKSFFERGIKSIKDDFFVTLITGYQGSGKTFLAVKLLEDSKDEKGRIIKTNIHSYHSTNHDVIYFDTIDDIYNDKDDFVTYVIDEISKRYPKDCKQDIKFYSWLQQSRKHSRHVYLITQEYIQVPTWLRGVANTVYSTSKLGFFPFYKTALGFPVLNNDTFDWYIEPYYYYIYKRTKRIALLYDTLESVDIL